MLIDGEIVNQNDNLCNCGKSRDVIHCPHCGRVNFYALKKHSQRPHPLTGVFTEGIRNFRCRTCGSTFDNLQWQFECKAPVSQRVVLMKKMNEDKHSLMNLARTGVKFSENDKRHFKKVTGINYEDFMAMIRHTAEKQKVIANTQTAIHKLENVAHRTTSVIKGMPKLRAPEEVKLTPLQYHIENCNKCMTDSEYCDVGKNLQLAERMPQP